MKVALLCWPFAAVLLFAACGLLGTQQPETAARDAYRVAKKACEVYELLPAERRTEEADRNCRSLRLVCGE